MLTFPPPLQVPHPTQVPPPSPPVRFANHSCDPTCELQKWSVCGEPRIALVSKRALSEGSEVTYNYQYYEDGLDITTLQRQKVTHRGVNTP